MYQAILLLLSALFVVIAWRDPRHGIFLIVALLPAYLLRFDVFGIPMTFLEVMILLLTIVWLIKKKGVPKISVPKSWRIPIALLFLSALMSTVVSPNTAAAFGVLKAYFIEPFLLLVIMMDVLKKTDVFPVLSSLGIGALFVSLVAIGQFLIGSGIPAPWDIEKRTTSVFPYPNAVGLYLGPMIVIGGFALQAALRMKSTKGLLFWGTITLTSILAILTSVTEAAWIAVPTTLFFFSLFSPKTRRFTVPIVFLLTIFIFTIPQVREPVLQKVLLQDYSGQVRISQWKDASSFLQDHLILGAGLSGYPTLIEPYHSRPENEIFQYPHNVLLNTWVELGLLGIIAFLWIGILAAQTVIRSARGKEHLAIIGVASLAALSEMFIHGLVDVPYFKNDLSVMTWIFLGIILLSCTHVAKPSHTS